MTFTTMQISWLWFDGAWYDIAGAVLLARSFLAVAPARLIAQSSSGYGGFSTHLLRMFCEQKIDAQLAGVFLVLGFLMQAMAALGMNIGVHWLVLAFLAPLPAGLAVYVAMRRRITRTYMRKALRTTSHLDSGRMLALAFNEFADS